MTKERLHVAATAAAEAAEFPMGEQLAFISLSALQRGN
jgi:hypothetical protein